jgi:hypothetical protein
MKKKYFRDPYLSMHSCEFKIPLYPDKIKELCFMNPGASL